jgi:hypothetical protein
MNAEVYHVDGYVGLESRLEDAQEICWPRYDGADRGGVARIAARGQVPRTGSR